MARKEYKIKKLIKETDKAYTIITLDNRLENMPKKSSKLIDDNTLLCESWSWDFKLKASLLKAKDKAKLVESTQTQTDSDFPTDYEESDNIKEELTAIRDRLNDLIEEL